MALKIRKTPYSNFNFQYHKHYQYSSLLLHASRATKQWKLGVILFSTVISSYPFRQATIIFKHKAQNFNGKTLIKSQIVQISEIVIKIRGRQVRPHLLFDDHE